MATHNTNPANSPTNNRKIVQRYSDECWNLGKNRRRLRDHRRQRPALRPRLPPPHLRGVQPPQPPRNLSRRLPRPQIHHRRHHLRAQRGRHPLVRTRHPQRQFPRHAPHQPQGHHNRLQHLPARKRQDRRELVPLYPHVHDGAARPHRRHAGDGVPHPPGSLPRTLPTTEPPLSHRPCAPLRSPAAWAGCCPTPAARTSPSPPVTSTYR